MSIKRSLFIFSLVSLFASGTAYAQAAGDERRMEIGIHYSAINLSPFASIEAGGGVRLSYNVTEYLSVEAEGNLFEFSIGDHPTDDVLAAQGLLGVKAGVRNRHAGVFAKFRPGVANFPSLRGPRGVCTLLPCEGSRRGGNRLALDTGAVIELYPTEKMIVRFDIGDTMIRFSDDSFFESGTRVRIKNGFSHNFQWGVGVGFRF